MSTSSKRKFWKRTIVVEILSEYDTDYEFDPYAAVGGDRAPVSCYVTQDERVEIDSVEAAKGLISQSSDPEFFGLDENGNEIDQNNDHE